jgi:hypothetical protein
MTPATTTDLRFPIGEFNPDAAVSAADLTRCIQEIAAAPAALRAAIAGLSEAQLDTRYRPDGWTVRQVVHHVPESHMQAYCRFKLALTEDVPTVKPYEESEWAKLPDVPRIPIEVSLTLLDALHARWVILLESTSAADFARSYFHPGYNRSYTLSQVTAMYAWHGKHHVAHITSLRQRSGW